MEAWVIFSIATTFSPLLPLFVYFKTRKLQAPYIKYLIVMLAASFVADFAGFARYFLQKNFQIHLPKIFRLFGEGYYLLAIVAIALLYRNLFPRRFSLLFFAGIAVVTTAYFLTIFLYETEYTNTPSRVPLAIAVMVVTIAYFFHLMTEVPSLHITRLPMFWINAGMLLYYAGNVMLFIFGTFLANYFIHLFSSFWIYHNILNMLDHILSAIGLWQVTRKVNSSSLNNQG